MKFIPDQNIVINEVIRKMSVNRMTFPTCLDIYMYNVCNSLITSASDGSIVILSWER